MKTEQKGFQRWALFALYLVGGVAVYLLGANTFDLFVTNRSPLYEWELAFFLLALALVLRGSEPLQKYWKVAYALFAAAFANALNLALGNWLGRLLPAPESEMQFLAVDKLAQAVPIITALVLLSLLAGDDLGAIFLQKGDLRRGLRFGLVSFGVFAALFIAIVFWQASGPAQVGLFASGVSLGTVAAALPWILIFIFTNSIMEELWFRGVVLGKLAPLLGTPAAVAASALVFGAAHLGATYVTPLQTIFFALIVFALGLVNAAMMLKTRSIWGSVLFHAGYDLFVILPLLAVG